MAHNDSTSAAEARECINATNRIVAALWREVLELNELPRLTDDFFALGGDSMTMVMLEFRIREDLLVELPVGAILGAPTLNELSALIHAARPTAAETRL